MKQVVARAKVNKKLLCSQSAFRLYLLYWNYVLKKRLVITESQHARANDLRDNCRMTFIVNLALTSSFSTSSIFNWNDKRVIFVWRKVGLQLNSLF